MFHERLLKLQERNWFQNQTNCQIVLLVQIERSDFSVAQFLILDDRQKFVKIKISANSTMCHKYVKLLLT